MEEFPSNSHPRPKPAKTVRPKDEKEDIVKITTGEVVTRKKPLSRKFRDLFLGGDAHSVGAYILFEVMIPAAKDTIADVFSQGIERMLFGEARSSSRRTGQRPGGSGGYVSYNRYSSSGPLGRRDEESRPMSRRARATHDFDEIILATRGEAEDVVDRLFELISRYDQVTVADLYDLVGATSNYTDQKWGWRDVRGAGVTRIASGYLLDLPRPELLD